MRRCAVMRVETVAAGTGFPKRITAIGLLREILEGFIRFRDCAFRVLVENGFRFGAAEAIGNAVHLGVDRAIGFHFLAHRQTGHTQVVVLSFYVRCIGNGGNGDQCDREQQLH